jgi:hypothetical protein
MEQAGPSEKPRSFEPAPEVHARDDVRAVASPVRCPFCHGDVEARESAWVACWGCLARHHPECWDELGRCASCGHDRFLPAAEARKTPGRARRAVARFARSARTPLFGALLLVLGPLLGVGIMVASMISSFQRMAGPDFVRPDDLASGVFNGMISMSVGLGLGISGLVIVLGWLVWFLKTRARPRAQDAAR